MTKRIAKLDASIDAMLMTQTTAFGMAPTTLTGRPSTNGTNLVVQQQQRKQKGRLCSLGGNEPVKRQRGRLDRLKTVGTFDMGMEMSSIGEVARSLNTHIISDRTSVGVERADAGHAMELRNAANKRDSEIVVTDPLDSNRCADDNRSVLERMRIRTTDKVQQFNCQQNDAVQTTTNYNKIELDMQSIEDMTKCCENTTGGGYELAAPTMSSRKPILLKSKRIMRSDSDIFDEFLPPAPTSPTPRTSPDITGRHKIVLQANYDIQIHQEPKYDQDINAGSTRSADSVASPMSANNGRRRFESRHLDAANDRIYQSIEGSSQNVSTDDMDTVFSHANELEQLDREYRDILRSNLQREYKSDGDSLDEVGKKCAEFTTWKNQSFENTFELYGDGAMVAAPYQTGSTTTSTSTNEAGSSTRVIKPILKQTSSKESTVSSPLPSNQVPIVDQRTANDSVASKEDQKLTTIATNLFEKRFGKICKINNLLKCKRFSTSALHDKKSAAAADAATGSASFKPATSSSSDSKTSLYSSKLSLFNCKAGRGLFAKRKPSLSQTELSQFPERVVQRTRVTLDHTKSHSDIHGYKTSSSASSATAAEPPSNPVHPVLLYRQPLQSPLSEEFYNPTGSVRLSAMELFEKFCSEDFSGLYKNETKLNLDRRGGTCGEYQSLHEYRLGQRGLGVTQKYNRINQDMQMRLLRQRSEPKFTFRDDTRTADGYFEEEDDEDVYDEQEDETFDVEDGEYDDEEYDDEFEQPDEEEEEEVDEEEDEECLDHQQPASIGAGDHPTADFSTNVDEIFLMPSHSKCEDYDECGFENKQFTLEQTLMTHVSGDAEDHRQQHNQLRTIALPQNGRFVRKRNEGSSRDDEVLTIYMLCSKDDSPATLATTDSNTSPSATATVTTSAAPPATSRTTSIDATSPTDSLLVQAVEEYVQNAPANLVDTFMAADAADCIYRTDCLSQNRLSRFESLEQLSSPSCTVVSTGTSRLVLQQPNDCRLTLSHSSAAVGQPSQSHLCTNILDTCSTTSKMSLSLKSEIFDDLILSPDGTYDEAGRGSASGERAYREICVARSCDSDDFRLTPDESPPTLADQLIGAGKLNSTVAMCGSSELGTGDSSRSVTPGAAAMDAVDLDVSTLTTEITQEFDALFSRAIREEEEQNRVDGGDVQVAINELEKCFNRLDPYNHHTTDADAAFLAPNTNPSKRLAEPHHNSSALGDAHHHLQSPPIDAGNGGPPTAATAQSTSLRQLSTRYSMQCLEPYLMFDEQASAAAVRGRPFVALSIVAPLTGAGRSDECGGGSTAKSLPMATAKTGGGGIGAVTAFGGVHGRVSARSYVQKHLTAAGRRDGDGGNRLQSNRSQSLGNLNNKTRCFPL